jgi:hypothetical protein
MRNIDCRFRNQQNFGLDEGSFGLADFISTPPVRMS